MPLDDLFEHKPSTVEALTLDKHDDRQQKIQEQKFAEIRNLSQDEMTAQVTKMTTVQKEKEVLAQNALQDTLMASAQELLSARKGAEMMEKANARADEYKQSSIRNFKIIEYLDVFETLLNDTGLTGSDDYMGALNSIRAYRNYVLKNDGMRTFPGAAQSLELQFNNMKAAIQNAIDSYDRRDIKSELRRGGKRRKLLQALLKSLSYNRENPQQIGKLYNAMLQSKRYETKRERELQSGDLEPSELVVKQYRDTIDSMINLRKKISEQKADPAREEKLTALEEKIIALNKDYVLYLKGVESLNTPPLTRLQKIDNEKRLKRWNKIKKNSQGEYSHVSSNTPIRRVSFSNKYIPELKAGIDSLKAHLQDLEEGQNLQEEKKERIQAMIDSLGALDKLHRDTMKFMGKYYFNFRKGTAANLEKTYDKALLTIKTIVRQGKAATDPETLRIAKEIKNTMEKGQTADLVGELIRISTYRENYIYESQEDIEAPISLEEMKQYTKTVSAKELRKNTDSMSIDMLIKLMARSGFALAHYDDFSVQYKIRNRQGNMQGAAKEVLDVFDAKNRQILDATDDLNVSVDNSNLERKVEVATALEKVQRRFNFAFLAAYKAKVKETGRTVSQLTKQEKMAIQYDLIVNTALGQAYRAISCKISEMGFSELANMMGLSAPGNGDDMISFAEDKLKANIFVENLSNEYESLIPNNPSSLDEYLRKGGDRVKEAEKARVDAFFAKLMKGSGLSEAKLNAFKGV